MNLKASQFAVAQDAYQDITMSFGPSRKFLEFRKCLTHGDRSPGIPQDRLATDSRRPRCLPGATILAVKRVSRRPELAQIAEETQVLQVAFGTWALPPEVGEANPRQAGGRDTPECSADLFDISRASKSSCASMAL